MCVPARSIASTRAASDGSGTRSRTSRIARSCNRPVSLPARRSITPPSGSGVLWPISARARAAALATPMWPQVRTMNTGWSGAAAVSSAAVGWRPTSSSAWS